MKKMMLNLLSYSATCSYLCNDIQSLKIRVVPYSTHHYLLQFLFRGANFEYLVRSYLDMCIPVKVEAASL